MKYFREIITLGAVASLALAPIAAGASAESTGKDLHNGESKTEELSAEQLAIICATGHIGGAASAEACAMLSEKENDEYKAHLGALAGMCVGGITQACSELGDATSGR